MDVWHLNKDLYPTGMSRACPSVTSGPFIGTDADSLGCGMLAGHDGAHTFHVEWTEDASHDQGDTDGNEGVAQRARNHMGCTTQTCLVGASGECPYHVTKACPDCGAEPDEDGWFPYGHDTECRWQVTCSACGATFDKSDDARHDCI